MFADINSMFGSGSASILNLGPFALHGVVRLAAAVFLGAGLSFLYVRVHDHKVKRSFANTLVVLPLGAAVVTMIIDNNLARAFGLLGAISVIRFRTAIQNTYDMVFVFIAIALGMACGCALYAIGMLSLLAFGATVTVLRMVNIGKKQGGGQSYYVTMKTVDVKAAMELFKRSICEVCDSCRFERLANGAEGTISFMVTLQYRSTEKELIETVTALRSDLITDVMLRKIEKE